MLISPQYVNISGLAADTTGLYIGMAILGLGAENLTMVVLAHISRSTDAVHRANVISSFTFQVRWLTHLEALKCTHSDTYELLILT